MVVHERHVTPHGASIAMSLSSGSRLGPYEIQSLSGVGSRGEVYNARHTRLDRTVAIQVLPATLAGNPQFSESRSPPGSIRIRAGIRRTEPPHQRGERR